MKNLEIVNFKNLTKLSERLGNAIETLNSLDPYIKFKDRFKYKKTCKYLDDLYEAVDKLIINITDKEERTKK
jgi:DNA-binding transcriptional regulator WhiA